MSEYNGRTYRSDMLCFYDPSIRRRQICQFLHLPQRTMCILIWEIENKVQWCMNMYMDVRNVGWFQILWEDCNSIQLELTYKREMECKNLSVWRSQFWWNNLPMLLDLEIQTVFSLGRQNNLYSRGMVSCWNRIDSNLDSNFY